MRYAARRDNNEGPIVEAARRIGLKVFYLKELGDLIVQHGEVTELWEVKQEKGKLTELQCKLRQQGLKAYTIRNVDDVLAARKRMICRTPPNS